MRASISIVSGFSSLYSNNVTIEDIEEAQRGMRRRESKWGVFVLLIQRKASTSNPAPDKMGIAN
jgi:hypothetical protein